MVMKQRYHTIIRPQSNGGFVGWVEEIPGTITQGRSLQQCRRNLRDALQLMLETDRDEARLALSPECLLESVEIDVVDELPYASMQPQASEQAAHVWIALAAAAVVLTCRTTHLLRSEMSGR